MFASQKLEAGQGFTSKQKTTSPASATVRSILANEMGKALVRQRVK